MPIKSSLTFLLMSQPTSPVENTTSSFRYDPAKTVTRATTLSSFSTATCWYKLPYPLGDQIRERGMNQSGVTEGETFSDLWMDNLIYATAIHASHHLRGNGNLDGYEMVIDLSDMFEGIGHLVCGMLNKLLMRGPFDPEMPPEKSDRWMTRLTRYLAVVGTKLLSYVESLWETAEKDRKIRNDRIRKIRERERKTMIQGRSLEDQDDMTCKLSGVVEKLGKALDVLTVKIIRLESHGDENGEQLNNHSHPLGCQELPQQVRESRLNLAYWI
jgi:hypothetical protein